MHVADSHVCPGCVHVHDEPLTTYCPGLHTHVIARSDTDEDIRMKPSNVKGVIARSGVDEDAGMKLKSRYDTPRTGMGGTQHC